MGFSKVEIEESDGSDVVFTKGLVYEEIIPDIV